MKLYFNTAVIVNSVTSPVVGTVPSPVHKNLLLVNSVTSQVAGMVPSLVHKSDVMFRSVTSMVTTMTWISLIGGHVEVVMDKQWQYFILEMSHAGVQSEDIEDTARNTGGHLGINKMCEKITSRFYWPVIKEEVIEFIKWLWMMPMCK